MLRKTAGTAAMLLVFCMMGVHARQDGQADYWGQIKAHMAEVNKAPYHGAPGAEAFVAYMDSLSADQMIVAGRQASAEVGARFPADQWPRASMALLFFYQYYPQTTDNLRDTEPLRRDIEDASQPPFWRWFLTDMLTRAWDQEGRLADDQRRQVSESLMRLYQQPDVPAPVVAEATRGVPRLLASMQKALPPLATGDDSGEARTRLSAVSEAYAKTAASLLARKGAPPEVQREALAGLVRVQQMSLSGSEAAKTTVAATARDYALYPEEMWPQIMLGASTMGVAVDLDSLLSRQEEAAKQKDTVGRLRTVRSVAALPEAPTQASAPADDKQSRMRRLSDCTEAELLSMAKRCAEALATNRVPEQNWSRLAAIVTEYNKRNRPAGG